jgi:hypothetical protein
MQKKICTRILLFATLSLTRRAWNNGLSTTPPGQLNPGAMTADISDGSLFTSSYSTLASDGVSNFSISGTQDIAGQPADEITMTIPKSDVLPYTITEASGNSELHYYDAAQGRDYAAKPGQGSFIITITSISPTIVGTFQGTLIFPNVADSVRVISNGAFNASF